MSDPLKPDKNAGTFRPAQDADHVPSNLGTDKAQLEEGLEETYPASDTPSELQPAPADATVAPPSTNAGMGTAASSKAGGSSTGRKVAEAARERARSEADKHKSTVAGGLKSVSSAVRTSSEELKGEASWMTNGLVTAANSIEDLAAALEDKSPDELARNVQTFAKQNPLPFLLGCAAVGFGVSRLFRASVEADGAGS